MVGHSAGGAVALRLALADPARVRTLVLVDSAGLGREVHPLLAVDTLPFVGELAILLSRLPGGNMGRTTMSAAMLFAQPWRAPADFLTEQHDLGRRPGQLEASTAMARALFDATGQRQILLDRLPAVTAPTLVIWGGCDYVLPAHQAQTAVDLLPPRAAGAAARLRTPTPRRAPRPLRGRAQRLADRARRRDVELNARSTHPRRPHSEGSTTATTESSTA